MAEQSSDLQVAIDILKSAKHDLATTLGKNHEMLRLGIEQKFNLMINQMAMLSGNPVSLEHKDAFQPVTNFLGDEITRKGQEIKAEELTPKELERKIFAEKVTTLRDSFPSLTNEQILEAYGKVDTIVLRGVAKQAGLDNFRDGKIDNQFVDDIRQGLKDQEDLVRQKEASDSIPANATSPTDTKAADAGKAK